MNLIMANLIVKAPEVLKVLGGSKVAYDADTDTIANGVQNISDTVWQFIDKIGTAVAVIALVCIFIKMIACSDSRTVAECKKQMLIIAIALIGIKFAPNLVKMVSKIGEDAKTGMIITNNLL